MPSSSSGREKGDVRSNRRTTPSPRKEPFKRAIQLFYSSDFERFHSNCGAVRYKVHRPNCECPKVQRILNGDREIRVQKVNDDSEADERLPPTEPYSGLIVVPDSKMSASFYFCLDTDRQTYDANPFESEIKLRKEIFPGDLGESTEFKVSCACCLLTDQPNGFACVSSTEKERVDRARDLARECAAEKEHLHADHAHHIVSIPRKALQLFYRAKTRNQIQQAQDEVIQYLVAQGVPIQPETSHIVMEHHLNSLLLMSQQNEEDEFWLVIVYDDTTKTKPRWALDLPGGKRHLGEDALGSAIRETEEETSLVWDSSWITKEVQSDKANRFFLLKPPDIIAPASENA